MRKRPTLKPFTYFLSVIAQIARFLCLTPSSKTIPYLTALPDSVVPLTGQFIQQVWVVVEENIEDVLQQKHKIFLTSHLSHLVCQLDLFFIFVMHGHVSSGPPVRNVSHPSEVHVHDPGVKARLPVVGYLVTGSVIVVETRGHGRHMG